MTNDDSRNWMWSEALQMLARAERLHREVFTPAQGSPRGINWEPPTDVLETDAAVLIFVALPGVDAEKVDLAIRGGVLLISGERVLPDELRTAIIHRLELPQGSHVEHPALSGSTFRACPTCISHDPNWQTGLLASMGLGSAFGPRPAA